ncbi:hypothetical protein INR49_029353 [Caranx melampygus]|nr:hypothetical protein INR49_029353 [Caranx melampygus]
MSQHHITIQEENQLPPVHKCSQCCTLYHCPLCSPHVYKPAHRYKVQRHLRCHLTRGIHFKGFSIYKCNLGCRPQAHFHCFCEKLFLNRNQFVHHLDRKHNSDLSVRVQDFHDDAELPQPPSPSLGERPDADLSAAINDTLSSCEGDYAAAWTSDTLSNMVPPPVTERPAGTSMQLNQLRADQVVITVPLISYFGDTDGRPIDQTVQRILERMLSNTFAQRMDWRGKNNKVSFASSCLKDIVNDAVRRNSVCARAADEAVESAVKKWLQQAGERDEARRREEVHH